jgi:hypothetical protein
MAADEVELGRVQNVYRNNRQVEEAPEGSISSTKMLGYIKGIFAAALYKSCEYNTYGCLGAALREEGAPLADRS